MANAWAGLGRIGWFEFTLAQTCESLRVGRQHRSNEKGLGAKDLDAFLMGQSIHWLPISIDGRELSKASGFLPP